jgi:hypothetical protein
VLVFVFVSGWRQAGCGSRDVGPRFAPDPRETPQFPDQL